MYNDLFVREIRTVFTHQKYPKEAGYDIAVIELDEEMHWFETLRPACLDIDREVAEEHSVNYPKPMAVSFEGIALD